MGFIDLHVHSNMSDGSFSPSDLVRMACEKGLYAFSLTDHDSVAGIPGALLASRSFPVKIIPGVEISSELSGKELHILGYHVDYTDLHFQDILHSISQFREERNIRICSQLRSYDVDIDYEAVRAAAGCRMITRDHIAAYLVAGGYAGSIREAFDRFLAKNRPCFIPMRRVSTQDAVRIIQQAGGTAVLAHPVQYRLSDQGYLQLFTLLKAMGIRGIEAVYPSNTQEDEQKFRSMAKELHMFITGGSDFHGMLKPGIDIGTGKGNLMIPQEILDSLN